MPEFDVATRVLATASHQLRSPFTAILGSLELLAQSKQDDEQRGWTQHALEAGRQLLFQLNTLIDFARLESGQLWLVSHSLEIQTVVESVVGIVASRAHAKQIAVATVIDPGIPFGLLGDPRRLGQLLLILLEQALETTTEGGIILRVALRAVNATEASLGFDVEDSGAALPEASSDGLFDPLVHSELFANRGLQRAFARALARLMGGDLAWRQSSLGGNCFSASLRLARADPETSSLTQTLIPLQHCRLLLVESHPIRAMTFAEENRMWGVDTRIVAEGREWRAALLDGWQPDLVLVHLASKGAQFVLADVNGIRTIGVVPLGEQAHPEWLPPGRTVEWISAPMRREALLSCLRGAPVPKEEVPREATSAENALRVLLAEDSEANRVVLSARLRRLGCHVEGVVGGSEAIRRMSQRDYDLVLLDLQMPDLDGIETAQRIRRLGGKAASTPMIAVTASSDPADRERCRAVGMLDCLEKPMDQQALDQMLRRVVALRSTVASPNVAAIEVLDRKVYLQLRDDLGPAFADVLERAQQEITRRMSDLSRHLECGAFAAARREAHAMKSVVATFGGRACARLAEHMESSLQNTPIESGASLDALQRSVTALLMALSVERS